jgi:hypothetical protein
VSTGVAAVIPGYTSYSILTITASDEVDTSSITINPTTGLVSTTPETPLATYTLRIRAGNDLTYTNTILQFSVEEAPPPPPSAPAPPRGKGFDFETYNALQAGNSLILERLQNTNLRFKSFEDYMKYRKAFATLKR